MTDRPPVRLVLSVCYVLLLSLFSSSPFWHVCFQLTNWANNSSLSLSLKGTADGRPFSWRHISHRWAEKEKTLSRRSVKGQLTPRPSVRVPLETRLNSFKLVRCGRMTDGLLFLLFCCCPLSLF